MGNDGIQNLHELIQKYTGPCKTVVKSAIKRLTAPGENYLGIMWKVEAILKNEDETEEDFNAVAKCLNFDINYIRDTIPMQFTKENAFYTEIIPTLKEFVDEMQVELNFMDIFPKLYASRRSLDESKDEPDENAVLLIEDLGVSGFSNIDRTVGFDLEGAKLILKDMAAFHAVPIALKLKKPEVFENKIKKHLYSLFEVKSETDPPPELPENETSLENLWLEILDEVDYVRPYYKQLEARLRKRSVRRIPNELFATIAHLDLWTNNTMQKIVDGKIIKNKFIDFQVYCYESMAADLVFFLWSSVQLPFARTEFDNLVRFYHSTFVDILDKYGCDITPFSYENFLKEIEELSDAVFYQIMLMSVIVYSKKGEAVFDVSEKSMTIQKKSFSEVARNRAAQVVVEFGKRGWL